MIEDFTIEEDFAFETLDDYFIILSLIIPFYSFRSSKASER